MPKADSVERLRRMVKILRLLGEKDRVSVNKLAKEFSRDVRTINRDLRFLKDAGFKIVRVAPGVYSAPPAQLKNLDKWDDDELAFIIATRRLVRQLMPDIESRLSSFWGVNEEFFSPIHISAGIPQVLNNETQETMRSLIGYIMKRREARFRYKDENDLRKVEPYKLAYLKGFWYLLARDTRDSKIKSYAIDRIKELSSTKRRFNAVPEKELQDVYYPYLGHEVRKRVKVRVKKDIAHYFKRKKFDLTQTIEKEEESGDLIVSFLTVSMEPIKNFVIKPWLPNIFVLSPESLREEVMAELQGWIDKSKAL